MLARSLRKLSLCLHNGLGLRLAATRRTRDHMASRAQQKPASRPLQFSETRSHSEINHNEANSVVPQLTPVLKEYWALKQRHSSFLLLFQIGDFFELYFDDAVRGAALMDISLTRRSSKDKQEIPMCGVPVHAVDNYIQKLIRKGVKVALCEQIGDVEEAKRARKRVTREITRLITPGTITEDQWLDAKRSNYLASIWMENSLTSSSSCSISWLDVSTGDFFVSRTTAEMLPSDLSRIRPSEILVPADIYSVDDELKATLRNYFVTPQPRENFSHESSGHFDSVMGNNNFFCELSPSELSAIHAVLHYVIATQRGKLPNLSTPTRFSSANAMLIDPATRRSLELLRTQSGEGAFSVLSVLDNTVTSVGGRLLARRLASPLISVSEIQNRLDVVQFFKDNIALTDRLRVILRSCADIERALQRVSLRRAGPRDLAAIRITLSSASDLIMELTQELTERQVPIILRDSVVGQIDDFSELVTLLESALVSNPPIDASHGDFISPKFDAELDAARKLRDQGHQYVLDLRNKYRDLTGISGLRLERTKHVGYHIEIAGKDARKFAELTDLPIDFIPTQSKKDSARFKTAELLDLESQFHRAASRVSEIEQNIFQTLCAEVLRHSALIQKVSALIASIDVYSGHALLARERGLCLPVVDDSLDLNVSSGRHFTVEAAHPDRAFVDNDCLMQHDEARLLLITGANMGGKSTFLRQNAVIAILAQIGCFVPAQSARLGVVDAIFCRVGASDDISADKSTFMVEMSETAYILRNATQRSLIIMDEVGRGTASNDGLAIAWAVLEFIHNIIGARTLFATHFHELTLLSSSLSHLCCYFTQVVEQEGRTVFTHKLVKGYANRSYGIDVAKMAGLPEIVIYRAQQLLDKLES